MAGRPCAGPYNEGESRIHKVFNPLQQKEAPRMKKIVRAAFALMMALGLVLSPASALIGCGAEQAQAASQVTVWRLYNQGTGEHFYTVNDGERSNLINSGWVDEGAAWNAPATSDTPVRRMYNKYTGDHHYTASRDEVKSLIHAGWIYEGICWYSADASTGTPLYRAYNKNAQIGSHHYTSSTVELQALVDAGWSNEGVAWYGLK